MGRKGSKSSTPSQGAAKRTNNKVMTLREENTGKKRADVASILKLKHLARVATWASSTGKIPPLGSMLGRHAAAAAEDSGLPLDPPSFLCQKCETVLCPGVNCTIRIKKNKKLRQFQNNAVYTCHFCLHENLKRGTPKGTVKNLIASRPRKSILATPKINTIRTVEESTAINSPETPMPKMVTTIDDSTSNSKRDDLSSLSDSKEMGSGSRKRQRKGWVSLKDKAKADASESAKRINRFASPFKI